MVCEIAEHRRSHDKSQYAHKWQENARWTLRDDHVKEIVVIAWRVIRGITIQQTGNFVAV